MVRPIKHSVLLCRYEYSSVTGLTGIYRSEVPRPVSDPEEGEHVTPMPRARLSMLCLRKRREVTTMKSCARRINASRRWFMKKALATMGATAAGGRLLAAPSGHLTRGDAALLRFAAAAEILEADFWVQYNELGGVPNTNEVPGGSGNPTYTAALQNLDMDMPQYIHDNTDDENTHFMFIDAYLKSKGIQPVNLDQFRM